MHPLYIDDRLRILIAMNERLLLDNAALRQQIAELPAEVQKAIEKEKRELYEIINEARGYIRKARQIGLEYG